MAEATMLIEEHEPPRRYRFRTFLAKTLSGAPARVGLALLVAIMLFVLLGPLFIHYSPTKSVGPPNQPPSLTHIFGTDLQGHDLASQMIWGAYPTLSVSLTGALGATLLGFFAGVASGYFGRLGSVIGAGTDAVMTLPTLPAILVIGSLFLATDVTLALLFIAFFWVPVARAVRAQVSAMKRLAFVDAEKASGLSDLEIAVKVMVPEVGAIAIAYFIINITIAIAIITTIEFLGVGNTTTVTWGNTLYWAEQYAFLYGDWWWVLAPGILISLVTVGFALTGFTLEEILNPRLRTKT